MLKIGVFGAGRLGKLHLDNWKKIPDIQIAGFYDPSDLAAKEVINNYNIKRYNSADQLIQACDVADVATPPSARFPLCKKAILKSRHVLVERPMANTMEQAREIVQLVKEANTIFMVGNVERFNPSFNMAIPENAPQFIVAYRNEPSENIEPVNVILDLMYQDIDIILSIANSNVKSVYANCVSVYREKPDLVNARIEFDNGCIADLTASCISKKRVSTLDLYRKGEHLSLDFLEKRSGSNCDALKAQLESFHNSIINRSASAMSEIDGLRSMEVAHLIIEKIGRNTAR